MANSKNFRPPQPHGEIEEIFPDVFFVTGTVGLSGPLPMRFSRNMTILRQDGELMLVNTVRLNDAGLQALDRLGKVTNIVRLAAFHGMDDPFYKHHYGAKSWSVEAPYLTGFGTGSKPYFEADETIDGTTDLPVQNAKVLTIDSATPTEGLMFLDREDGIIVSGDCLQNWARSDRFFSLPAKVMMRFMGFIKPHNVGPGWLKAAKPDVKDVKAILDHKFEHVLPAHGTPVIGDAKRLYSPAIEAL